MRWSWSSKWQLLINLMPIPYSKQFLALRTLGLNRMDVIFKLATFPSLIALLFPSNFRFWEQLRTLSHGAVHLVRLISGIYQIFKKSRAQQDLNFLRRAAAKEGVTFFRGVYNFINKNVLLCHNEEFKLGNFN